MKLWVEPVLKEFLDAETRPEVIQALQDQIEKLKPNAANANRKFGAYSDKPLPDHIKQLSEVNAVDQVRTLTKEQRGLSA